METIISQMFQQQLIYSDEQKYFIGNQHCFSTCDRDLLYDHYHQQPQRSCYLCATSDSFRCNLDTNMNKVKILYDCGMSEIQEEYRCV